MKIRLPNTFADLTLSQWKTLQVHKDNKDCLMALCDEVTPRNITTVSQAALVAAYSHLDMLRQTEAGQHVDKITVAGSTYGFIPNWQEFTLGEYIDMEMYCKDVAANCNKIMSLLYRKVTKQHGSRYAIELYTSKEDQEIWDDVPATVFGGTLLFFSSSKKSLLQSSRHSLIQAMAAVGSSSKSGDGIPRYMLWLAKASLTWTQLQKRAWGLRSRTFRI